MREFIIGGRWVSEAEPELGLGILESTSGKMVSLFFPSSSVERTYGVKTAPLKRVIFSEGDQISTDDGQKLTVTKVENNDGLVTYICNDVSIGELHLSSLMSFSRPQDKLLNGLLSSPDHFDLRIRTLENKRKYFECPVKGMIGAKISLIPHQLYVAKQVFLRSKPRVLLSDEVGLGKTIEAGMIIHQHLTSGRSERVLVIVPDSLQYQWFLEMYRKFSISMSVVNQETHLEKGVNPFLENELIIVGLGLLKGSSLARELLGEAHFDVLVVDEAHHIGWSATKGESPEYKIVKKLSERTSGVLLLTATPEQLGPEGHFSRLKLLDPDRFFCYQNYIKEHQSSSHFADIAKKLKNDLLLDDSDQELLAGIGIDGESDNSAIIKGLLERHGTGRIFFRNSRDNMAKEFDFFPQRIPTPHLLTHIDKKTSSHYEKDIFREKALWLISHLEDNNEFKVLLICKSKAKVLALDKIIKEHSASVVTATFHSDLSLMARDRQAAYFAEPEGARVLLCTEIGSEGRNFEFCHQLVLFDLPENPDYLEQRIGRLDRIGQKSDITIHIPLILGSREHHLYRWYQDGFDAFSESSKCGGAIYRKFKNIVEELNVETEEEQILALISETRSTYKLMLSEFEQGRDLLVEMNSFNEKMAYELKKEIATIDNDEELFQYMEEVFNLLGVSSEELGNDSFFIRPTENMLLPHFPELTDSGKTITYERKKGCERDDFTFITWDHPMVQGVINLIESEAVGVVTVLQRKKTNSTKIFFECFFILECVQNKKLESSHYFPPQIIRVLIDSSGEDFSLKWTKEFLDEKIEKPSREVLAKVKLFPKDACENILSKATVLANVRSSVMIEESIKAMSEKISTEIERLSYLKTINPSVSQDEIDYFYYQQKELEFLMTNCELRLDSFRVIF